MDYEALHELVHRDAKAAWPHVLALIERNSESDLERSELIGDVAFSEALPELIDDIERAFAVSTRLQKTIMKSEFGGG